MDSWNKFDYAVASRLEENDFLIITNGRIIQATHDAMNRYFSYIMNEGNCVISYRDITHYAEINWPEDLHDR